MVTVVCDTGVFVQDIFFLGAAADVMNDERRAVFRAAVGDDVNVRTGVARQLVAVKSQRQMRQKREKQ